MTTATNQPISNVDDLAQVGGQPVGSPSLPFNAGAATLTATGNVPARAASAGDQPQYFEFNVTAAAVVLTLLHPTGATAWVNGDEIGFVSTSTLANTATISDTTGPTTLAVLPTTAGRSYARVRYNGAAFTFIAGGAGI